jgi:hypothetical protein
MLCILMSCTQLGNCKCLHLLLQRLLPLLPLLLPLRPLRLPRLLLSPHLRCLPQMCCCLLLVLCLLQCCCRHPIYSYRLAAAATTGWCGGETKGKTETEKTKETETKS